MIDRYAGSGVLVYASAGLCHCQSGQVLPRRAAAGRAATVQSTALPTQVTTKCFSTQNCCTELMFGGVHVDNFLTFMQSLILLTNLVAQVEQ